MFSHIWSTLERELLDIYRYYRRDLSAVRAVGKEDGTVLSEADLAIQACVVAAVRRNDPSPAILAEELEGSPLDDRQSPPDPYLENQEEGQDNGYKGAGRLWIVDPIDGTTQFLRSDGREFCTAIAVLEDGRPKACLILAPELGEGGEPVTLTVDEIGTPRLNGHLARLPVGATTVSATRRSTADVQPIEEAAIRKGYRVKTMPTSQILDIARTCVHLGIPNLPPFLWCVCRAQYPWDVMAGCVLAHAVGVAVVLGRDTPLFPLTPGSASLGRSHLSSIVVATPGYSRWVSSMVNT